MATRPLRTQAVRHPPEDGSNRNGGNICEETTPSDDQFGLERASPLTLARAHGETLAAQTVLWVACSERRIRNRSDETAA